MEGPRGRIALMRAAADGRIGVGGAFREHLESCLGCRSCETACPSGVRYGALLEDARAAIEVERRESGTYSRAERFARWLCLHQLLPHRRRLRWLARLAKVARAAGLLRLTEVLAPDGLRRAISLLPSARGGRVKDRRPAPAIGERRGTVAFFRGCVQDAFLPSVNAATVRVLQRCGYEVHFPERETCCGAAALHLGETELARELARRNLGAFDDLENYDAIVSNAGGCGALLKEYPQLLSHEGSWDPRAESFVAKVRDVSELLADRWREPSGAPIPRRVTYVDSCHLRHAQKVADAPRKLLRRIPGLELVELERPDYCCGSAGVYNLLRAEDADRILDLKLEDVRATEAELIVTTNPGCQLQIQAGVRKAGLNAEVVHLVELLDRADRDGEAKS